LALGAHNNVPCDAHILCGWPWQCVHSIPLNSSLADFTHAWVVTPMLISLWMSLHFMQLL